MGNKVTINKYETKAVVDEYRTKAIVAPYSTKVTNIKMVAPEFLLDSVSDIELAFAPWKISGSQTDILKVRRSSDDSEDIIQADSNGIISDDSVMKTSGQDLRTWTNDYNDTLFVVEYYFPSGTGMGQSTNANQPEFDPINWDCIYDGTKGLESVSDDAPGKWEPFFQNNFACIFYCKRTAVNNDFRHIGAIRRTTDTVRFDVWASDGSVPNLSSNYRAGSSGNGFSTNSNYQPYNGDENTNDFTITVWADFTGGTLHFRYNGSDVETIDISAVDPSLFDFSIGQIKWIVGALSSSINFPYIGNIVSHALISSPTASKISTVETKLREPVNAYTAYFVENNSGYLLVASVLERQSFYQNRSCRIRRSSDNAEVNVLWDSNNELSNSSKLEGSGDDLGTWAGNDTLFVPKVFDASGYEDHLIQSDTTKQPTLDVANNNVVFASGDELVTEVSGFTVNSDFQTLRKTEFGEQPISSIKTTAEFYNEIRLEEGYSDGQNVNPLTNFADSTKPNATQATPSKQVEFVANDINGHPSMLMDGVDDYYDLGDSYEDVFKTDFGFVFVIKALEGKASGRQSILAVYDSAVDNGFQININSAGDLENDFEAGGNRAGYKASIFAAGENPWKIILLHWNFTNNIYTMEINGTSIAVSNFVGGDISTIDPSLYSNTLNPYIGARNFGGSDGLHINMRLAGKVFTADTLTELQDAATKLNDKYAIY